MSAKAPSAAAAQPEQVEVTLDKPHTHKGVLHPAGAKIQVTHAQKQWLQGQGLIGGKQEEQANG